MLYPLSGEPHMEMGVGTTVNTIKLLLDGYVCRIQHHIIVQNRKNQKKLNVYRGDQRDIEKSGGKEAFHKGQYTRAKALCASEESQTLAEQRSVGTVPTKCRSQESTRLNL